MQVDFTKCHTLSMITERNELLKMAPSRLNSCYQSLLVLIHLETVNDDDDDDVR